MNAANAPILEAMQKSEQDDPNEQLTERPNKLIKAYLLERSSEFQILTDLRQRGWNNPQGDVHFQNQRRTADECDMRMAFVFYNLMKRIGRELHQSINAFSFRSNHGRILDLCMAPGGFLEMAMHYNPGCSALAFSLPTSMGGHKALLPQRLDVDKRFLDITMLAEDMGVDTIPPEHPDANPFLPRQFQCGQFFDLVICDGQALRTHIRSSYREKSEARRLVTTQLALGLLHLKPGGTMVVLLHKIEAWQTVKLLCEFQKFSCVKLWKPKSGHATRSSFYLVASDVQSGHHLALQSIESWKKTWRVATFGSEEEYSQLLQDTQVGVGEMLDESGPQLLEWGENIWKTQANALSKMPFIRDSDPKPTKNSVRKPE